MRFFAGMTAAAAAMMMLAAIPAVGRGTGQDAGSVQVLNARMKAMLQDVARQNEAAQPNTGGLRTIVRVRVNPTFDSQLRGDLTGSMENYIDAHWGDCRANTTMYALSAPAPNPSNRNIRPAYVDFPVSTLLGEGNLVQTTYANGVVDQCGR